LLGKSLLRELVRPHQVGNDTRLQPTFYRIASKVITGGPPAGCEESLGIKDALFRELLQFGPVHRSATSPRKSRY
ncbi:MAG TPA: hypothetical protein VFA18_07910, partial [Gemmataceae bacterium]|nr:hypothetical protein [Gemmataceae bacterium]